MRSRARKKTLRFFIASRIVCTSSFTMNSEEEARVAGKLQCSIYCVVVAVKR